MSPGSSTESYPAFAHIGLRENPGKNLNQVQQNLYNSYNHDSENCLIYEFRSKEKSNDDDDDDGEMSPRSNGESYPAIKLNSNANLLGTWSVIETRSDMIASRNCQGYISVAGVPEFCPAGVLLHANKSTDMSLSHLSTLKCCQPGPGSNPQPRAQKARAIPTALPGPNRITISVTVDTMFNYKYRGALIMRYILIYFYNRYNEIDFISQHIDTTKHKNALSKATGKKISLLPTVIATSSRKSQFAFDLCKAFLAAEIPLWKVQG
ncbi:hypothetical protein ANN_14200 [Periplaneta americana]|uniref:Uncharacterized protein n=1 Tax=Periplaneta americana TaxID=6978 RepID=A0ABQ8SWV9_PERAM|nr:hypothetical protein ANN_14200 [Periplaneta americana]